MARVRTLVRGLALGALIMMPAGCGDSGPSQPGGKTKATQAEAEPTLVQPKEAKLTEDHIRRYIAFQTEHQKVSRALAAAKDSSPQDNVAKLVEIHKKHGFGTPDSYDVLWTISGIFAAIDHQGTKRFVPPEARLKASIALIERTKELSESDRAAALAAIAETAKVPSPSDPANAALVERFYADILAATRSSE